MSEIIGFCNQKGGVGKTTTAINLAASLAFSEKKILIIDLDPQGNATTGLGFNRKSIKSSIYDIMLGEEIPSPQKTALPFLDLIPSTTDLVGAEVELMGLTNREYRVKNGLQSFLERYDFIFIDAPPSLGLLTINLLAAATSILIPVQCEYYAMEGLSDLIKTIALVQQRLNPGLSIGGILLTMFDGRNRLARDVEQELRQHFKEKVFQTVIPRSVRLSEAPSHGKPVILYDLKSRGAQSYLELAEEFLARFSTAGGGEAWNEKRLVGGLPR